MLIFLVGMMSAQAQIFAKKKMPVGVKTYSFFEEQAMYQMEFKDFKGSLDKYNFYALDEDVKNNKLTIVYDRKLESWRLPLTYNEAMGISDKDGEEPLQRLEVLLSIISPAIRDKIE